MREEEDNIIGWTQWMNALQSQAEELAMQQIYSL